MKIIPNKKRNRTHRLDAVLGLRLLACAGCTAKGRITVPAAIETPPSDTTAPAPVAPLPSTAPSGTAPGATGAAEPAAQDRNKPSSVDNIAQLQLTELPGGMVCQDVLAFSSSHTALKPSDFVTVSGVTPTCTVSFAPLPK